VSLDSYSVAQTAKLLQRSTKRVRQMITENKLVPIPDIKPIQIPAQQVHDLREQYKNPSTRAAAQQGTGLTFEQVKELVESFTQKALESATAQQQQAQQLQQQQAQELKTELEAEREKVRALEQQLLEQQQKKRGLFRR
jgi:putative protein kinase ArgK-like GTPase of G3E family